MVATGLTASLLVCSSSAIRVAIEPFYPDSSLQRVDSIPPGKPVLAFRKIWRGFGATALPGGMSVANSESDGGSITFTMGFPDASVRPRGRFGYFFHFVDGHLPEGLEFTPDAYSTAMRGDSAYPYIEWPDGSFWAQDAFAFRVSVSVIDSAGNEGLPSNIVTVSHDGNQEERKMVAYEQYYLGFSPKEQPVPRWTGTDESGASAWLQSSWSGSEIELHTGAGVVKGQLHLQVGAGPGRPHRIDIYFGRDDKQAGIYEMHGDSLRLCLAPRGAAPPTTFNHDGATHVYTLKRSAQ